MHTTSDSILIMLHQVDFPILSKFISTETRIESEAAQALKDAFDNHIGGMAGQNLRDADSNMGRLPFSDRLYNTTLSRVSVCSQFSNGPSVGSPSESCQGGSVGAGDEVLNRWRRVEMLILPVLG